MSSQLKQELPDDNIQNILGSLLRVGVILSSIIVLIGGLMFLNNHADETVSFEKFKAVDARFSSVTSIIAGLKNFDGLAIIQFGVLLLIFTPIARIIFSIFSFFIEKDYMYVVIGLIVLCIIFTSLYLDVAY